MINKLCNLWMFVQSVPIKNLGFCDDWKHVADKLVGEWFADQVQNFHSKMSDQRDVNFAFFVHSRNQFQYGHHMITTNHVYETINYDSLNSQHLEIA